MHYLAALLVTEHLNDLLREAEAERRSALVRGARRFAWSAFIERPAGLLRRLVGSGRRGSVPPRPVGPSPATA